MWIEVKPRTGKKETLFIFKFTSQDDLTVFIKMLQLYSSMTSDQGIKQYMLQFIGYIQKRCDGKFADNRAKLSASIFADEIAMFTDCLNRICFEYEMAHIKSFASGQPDRIIEKEPDNSEFLKKEAGYLDKIRVLTESLKQAREEAEQQKLYCAGIKNMISNNQIAFVTEQGNQAPSYVVMSYEQYKLLASRPANMVGS